MFNIQIYKLMKSPFYIYLKTLQVKKCVKDIGDHRQIGVIIK